MSTGRPKPPPRQPRRAHQVPSNDKLPKPSSFDDYDTNDNGSYYQGDDYIDDEQMTNQSSIVIPNNNTSTTNNTMMGEKQRSNSLLSMTPETVIGGAVTMKGELAFVSLLKVDGGFEGKLVSEGSLIIGKSGKVTGDVINMKEVLINGKLVGNVNVEKVILRGKGMIYGDVTCKSFTCEAECIVVGKLNINPFAPSNIDANCNVVTAPVVTEPMPIDNPEEKQAKTVVAEEKKIEPTTTPVEGTGENKKEGEENPKPAVEGEAKKDEVTPEKAVEPTSDKTPAPEPTAA